MRNSSKKQKPASVAGFFSFFLYIYNEYLFYVFDEGEFKGKLGKRGGTTFFVGRDETF